nr:hypothetical protein [Micromonospora sp. DSM 115978]
MTMLIDELDVNNLPAPHLKIVIELLSRTIYRQDEMFATMEDANISPAEFKVSDSPKLLWTAVVFEAAQRSILNRLLQVVAKKDKAFAENLGSSLQQVPSPQLG